MSEFRVNSITNQDGSAGAQMCGVSTFSGNLVFGYRVVHQIFVDMMVVEEEEECLEVVHIHCYKYYG